MKTRRTPPRRKLPSSRAIPIAEMRGWWRHLDDFCKERTAEGWTLPKSVTLFPGLKNLRLELRVSRPMQDGRNGTEIVRHTWKIPGGTEWASLVARL